MKKSIQIISTLILGVCSFNGLSNPKIPLTPNHVESFAVLTAATGRIAIIADGNYRDPDDIAGTPVSLAILRAFGKEKKLVHYSHSCDLRKAANDADPPNNLRHKDMQLSCDGTAQRWGGFEHITFYNCQTQKEATINHLRDQINASTSSDPLWIIEAGEPDIIWEAMNKAQSAKRKLCYIVTHHPNNDRGDDYNLVSGGAKGNIVDLGFPAANIRDIPDQNTLLKKPLSTWNWAKNHSDSRIKWLYERGFRAQEPIQQYGGIVGDMDPSDAGMIYYWCTLKADGTGGDTKCDVPKLEKLFTDYVKGSDNNPIIGPPGYTYIAEENGTIAITSPVDIAYGSNGTFIYLKNQTQNVTCSNTAFGSDPIPGVKKYCFVKSAITGVESTEVQNLKVYPNPSVDGVFYLSKNEVFNVLSEDGEVLIKDEGKSINLSNYPSGIYILQTSNTTIKLVR